MLGVSTMTRAKKPIYPYPHFPQIATPRTEHKRLPEYLESLLDLIFDGEVGKQKLREIVAEYVKHRIDITDIMLGGIPHFDITDYLKQDIITMTLEYEYSPDTTERSEEEWNFLKLHALTDEIPTVKEINTYIRTLIKEIMTFYQCVSLYLCTEFGNGNSILM
jgi:hypothetical protein